MAGYRNLVKLSSLAYTEGFYTKPRVDRELLAKYSEGLIVSSACLAGEIAHEARGGRRRRAPAKRRPGTPTCSRTATTSRCRRTTPRGRPSSTRRSSSSATELDLPDHRDERRALPARRRTTTRTTCCSASVSARTTPTRTGCTTTGASTSRARPEMRERFPDRADVLENTLRIADEAGFAFEKKYSRSRRSRFRPGSRRENELLVKLATAGARERYGDGAVRRSAGAARLRARRHHEDRLRRLLPDRRTTSSRRRATATSRSDPAADRRRDRSSRTRCGSPTSVRSSSISSSSAS